jgi:hypothetical protein
MNERNKVTSYIHGDDGHLILIMIVVHIQKELRMRERERGKT